jgi:N-acetylmuramoyl-L-alanine amidase
MNSSRAETLYARGIFNAFLNYRKRHGGSITIPYMKMDDPVPEPPVVEEAKVEPVEAKSVNASEPEVVETPQAAQSESKQPEVKKPAASGDAPVFKVQILSSSSKLKTSDARFKGLKDIDYYQDGALYKYTVGSSTNYNEIYRLRKEVAAKIPEAFIIAFKDGKRMDVNAAIREFKSKK